MTQIGLLESAGASASVKLNGKARGMTPSKAKVSPKAQSEVKAQVNDENAKVKALGAFVAGLSAFHKASVSCRVLVVACVTAGCTRDEMVTAGEEAGFDPEWVKQVVRTEAGLRERGERSDKGSAKNPHAKAVLKYAMELTEDDMRDAASALLAAYKLAKKALAK